MRRKIFVNLSKKLRPRCWPEETTLCYKIPLVQWLITNLNVTLYLSTCHTVYINVLILFIIIPWLIIYAYVSLMYELKKTERYLRVTLLWPGPRLMKKEFTGPRSHKVWETLFYIKEYAICSILTLRCTRVKMCDYGRLIWSKHGPWSVKYLL